MQKHGFPATEAKERNMPHVVVKRWPGKSKRHKARLSVAIVKGVMNVLNYGEESVSVAIEEVKLTLPPSVNPG